MAASLAERLVQPGSPFELVPAGPPGSAARLFRHAPTSLNSVYQQATGSAAQACMHFWGREVAYGEILSAAAELGHVLRGSHGIIAGQRVAVILPTCPQWLMAFIAITSTGAVAVLIPPHDPPARILSLLESTKCVAVITDEECSRMLAERADCRARILVHHCSAQSRNASCQSSVQGIHAATGQALFDTKAIDPEQEALIAFTTGSTAAPKGVISSHRAVITGIMNMMLCSALASARNRLSQPPQPRLQSPPSSLLLAPLTHVSGYSHLLLMMRVAGKVVPLPAWHAQRAASLIEQHRLRLVSGANPAQLRELLRSDPHVADITSLVSIGVHGEALYSNILAEISERLPGATPGTGYGLTETNGSVCAAVGADLLQRPGTCGPIAPSVEIRIIDEQGLEVAAGGTGEIWLRGAMLMSGYCVSGKESPGVSAQGWFCTEDFGRVDPEGFLFLAERRQEIFYSNNGALSVASIERRLYECECVDEAAAVFVEAGQRLGKVFIAVVPRRGTAGHERVIAASLGPALPAEECELKIVTFTRLPRLATGKVDRHALRRALIHETAAQGAL